MTINTFKKLCLKANTKRADEIHDYYIKLEELIHQTLNEQTNELRQQLIESDNFFNERLKKQQELDKHNMILKSFEITSNIVYIIRVCTLRNGH